MKKILLFITVFFACLIPRWYLLPFTGVRVYHMRISIYCISLVVLFLFILIQKKRKDIVLSGTRDLLVFFIWLVVSSILIVKTEDYHESITSFYYIALGLLSIFVLNLAIQDFESLKVCFCAVFCGVLLHLSIGYYEMLSNHHLFSVALNDELRENASPVSIFYNNNDYATFIIVMLPLVVGFFRIFLRGAFSKVLSVLFAAIGLYIVIYAQSDTLIISFALVILTLFLVHLYKKYGKVATFLFGFFLLSVSLVVVLISLDSIRVYLDGLSTVERCRINLIRNGFLFLRDSHGLGIGYGNIQPYLQYYSSYDVYGVYYFHNWYLEILFSGGIVCFVCYMIFHITKVRTLFSLSGQKENPFLDNSIGYNPSKVFLISLLIFSAVCISSSSNLYSEWMWMYFGLISAYTNLFLKSGNGWVLRQVQ